MYEIYTRREKKKYPAKTSNHPKSNQTNLLPIPKTVFNLQRGV